MASLDTRNGLWCVGKKMKYCGGGSNSATSSYSTFSNNHAIPRYDNYSRSNKRSRSFNSNGGNYNVSCYNRTYSMPAHHETDSEDSGTVCGGASEDESSEASVASHLTNFDERFRHMFQSNLPPPIKWSTHQRNFNTEIPERRIKRPAPLPPRHPSSNKLMTRSLSSGAIEINSHKDNGRQIPKRRKSLFSKFSLSQLSLPKVSFSQTAPAKFFSKEASSINRNSRNSHTQNFTIPTNSKVSTSTYPCKSYSSFVAPIHENTYYTVGSERDSNQCYENSADFSFGTSTFSSFGATLSSQRLLDTCDGIESCADHEVERSHCATICPTMKQEYNSIASNVKVYDKWKKYEVHHDDHDNRINFSKRPQPIGEERCSKISAHNVSQAKQHNKIYPSNKLIGNKFEATKVSAVSGNSEFENTCKRYKRNDSVTRGKFGKSKSDTALNKMLDEVKDLSTRSIANCYSGSMNNLTCEDYCQNSNSSVNVKNKIYENITYLAISEESEDFDLYDKIACNSDKLIDNPLCCKKVCINENLNLKRSKYVRSPEISPKYDSRVTRENSLKHAVSLDCINENYPDCRNSINDISDENYVRRKSFNGFVQNSTESKNYAAECCTSPRVPSKGRVKDLIQRFSSIENLSNKSSTLPRKLSCKKPSKSFERNTIGRCTHSDKEKPSVICKTIMPKKLIEESKSMSHSCNCINEKSTFSVEPKDSFVPEADENLKLLRTTSISIPVPENKTWIDDSEHYDCTDETCAYLKVDSPFTSMIKKSPVVWCEKPLSSRLSDFGRDLSPPAKEKQSILTDYNFTVDSEPRSYLSSENYFQNSMYDMNQSSKSLFTTVKKSPLQMIKERVMKKSENCQQTDIFKASFDFKKLHERAQSKNFSEESDSKSKSKLKSCIKLKSLRTWKEAKLMKRVDETFISNYSPSYDVLQNSENKSNLACNENEYSEFRKPLPPSPILLEHIAQASAKNANVSNSWKFNPICSTDSGDFDSLSSIRDLDRSISYYSSYQPTCAYPQPIEDSSDNHERYFSRLFNNSKRYFSRGSVSLQHNSNENLNLADQQLRRHSMSYFNSDNTTNNVNRLTPSSFYPITISPPDNTPSMRYKPSFCKSTSLPTPTNRVVSPPYFCTRGFDNYGTSFKLH